MKRIYSFLFVTMAMLMLSVSSAWAQYVKFTAEDGMISWIPIKGKINGTNIVIYSNSSFDSAFDKNIKGSIDLNEVWSLSGGEGTQYQVTSIGSNAFHDCNGLTSIVIPSSVNSIGLYPFVNCSSLTSMVVESGNSVYDSRNNCNAIIETFSNTLIEGCMSTKIPFSVTSIGNVAFSGCSGLTSIDIPSSVTSIGNVAFSGCSGLTSIDIPSSVTSIGSGAFSLCSGLTSIDIPSSVTNIGEGVFGQCSGLTSINIPSSVTSIGNYAFSGCSGLTSIDIPSSVTSIGSGAFSGCSNLTSVTSYIIDVFETGGSAFYDCENATLYVPKGLVNTYQSTADWSRIKKIEEIEIPSLALSCNNKGKVKINGATEFTNDMGEVDVNYGVDNTFIFQPNENCQLEQVLIDGLDVTLSVKNNQLTTKIHEGSKMIVTFSKSSGDVNGDGHMNINDVVALVNMILGQ